MSGENKANQIKELEEILKSYKSVLHEILEQLKNTEVSDQKKQQELEKYSALTQDLIANLEQQIATKIEALKTPSFDKILDDLSSLIDKIQTTRNDLNDYESDWNSISKKLSSSFTMASHQHRYFVNGVKEQQQSEQDMILAIGEALSFGLNEWLLSSKKVVQKIELVFKKHAKVAEALIKQSIIKSKDAIFYTHIDIKAEILKDPLEIENDFLAPFYERHKVITSRLKKYAHYLQACRDGIRSEIDNQPQSTSKLQELEEHYLQLKTDTQKALNIAEQYLKLPPPNYSNIDLPLEFERIMWSNWIPQTLTITDKGCMGSGGEVHYDSSGWTEEFFVHLKTITGVEITTKDNGWFTDPATQEEMKRLVSWSYRFESTLK